MQARSLAPGSPEVPEVRKFGAEPSKSQSTAGSGWAAGGPPRPQGDAQPDISASCYHIRPPAIHGRLWTSPCGRGGPPNRRGIREVHCKERRPSWRRLPACRRCHCCRNLPTSHAGPANAGTFSGRRRRHNHCDVRAGAGECPGPSRAPGGVLPAGHGWPAAGRGSWTRTPAGGAHPPVRATGGAARNGAHHRAAFQGCATSGEREDNAPPCARWTRGTHGGTSAVQRHRVGR